MALKTPIEKLLKEKGIVISHTTTTPEPEPLIMKDDVDIQTQLKEDELAERSQLANEEREDTLRIQNLIIRSQKRGRLKIVRRTPKPEPVTSLLERRNDMEKPSFNSNALPWKIFLLLFSKTEGITHQEIYDALMAQGVKTTPGSVSTATRVIMLFSDRSVLWRTKELTPKGGSLRDRYHYRCPPGKTITELYMDFLAAKQRGEEKVIDRVRVDVPVAEAAKTPKSTEKLRRRKISIEKITNTIEAAKAEKVQPFTGDLLVPRTIEIRHHGEVTININLRISLTN